MPNSRILAFRCFFWSMFCAAALCLNAAAATTSVAVSTPAGQYFFPGTTVTVSVNVTVTASTANFTATFDVSCTVNGTAMYTQTGYEIHTMTTSATDSTSFPVQETAAGTNSVQCTASGSLSGDDSGSFSGTGSGSFTVTNCTGDSDYSETSTEAGGYETTTFTLTATMNPPNTGTQTGSATGTGITGDLAVTPYADDCDGDPNDNLSEEYAEVADNTQEQQEDGSVIFTFTVTNYKYNPTQCDSCDTYPEGYYPVTSTPYTTPAKFQAYCGTTN